MCPDTDIGKECTTIPNWVSISKAGTTFWCVTYSFLILFPMSIPRNPSSLKYSSLIGMLSSIYICLAITCVFFKNKELVPDYQQNLRTIEPFRFSFRGFLGTFPMIIFSFMYQVNIPMFYAELERRNA